MCEMRRWAVLAALAGLGAVAAGCLGGGGHATLSAGQALAQARSDGFQRSVLARRPATYLCGERRFQTGISTSGRDAGYTRPTYQFEVNGSRGAAGNVSGILMMVTVFPHAALARRCADAGIYLDLHPLPVGNSARVSRRQIDSETVLIGEHKPGAPGAMSPQDTGQYDVFLADGRVFAQGVAGNEHDTKIVREALERLAGEIAG
jgi:hypothetical protein